MDWSRYDCIKWTSKNLGIQIRFFCQTFKQKIAALVTTMHRIIFKKIYFFNVRIKKLKIARKSREIRQKASIEKWIFKDPSDDGQNESTQKWQKWPKNKLTISWQSFNSRFVNFRLPDWSNSALHAANWLSFVNFRKKIPKFRQKFCMLSYGLWYVHLKKDSIVLIFTRISI